MKNLSNLLQLTKQAASEQEQKPESSQQKPLVREIPYPDGVVREITYPNGTVSGSGPWQYSPTTDPMERILITPDDKVTTDIRELLARKNKNMTALPNADITNGLMHKSTNIDFDKINEMYAHKNLFDDWSTNPTLDNIANIKRMSIGDAVQEYMGKTKDSLKKKDNSQDTLQPTMQQEEKGMGTKLWDWVKENPGLAGAGALGLTGLGYYLLKDDEDEEEQD